MYILGISAFYHDSAACLVHDGEIIAAAQEERFTREKHDAAFPKSAIAYCLREAGIRVNDIDIVAFYDKPFLKFERILETYLAYVPRGLRSFEKAMPLWMKEKIWIRERIREDLKFQKEILFLEHHESHAASAFFPSPFDRAAILTMDGVGEWATTSYGVGKGNAIRIDSEISFPHSIGLLYSAFTYFTGFKVNSGEYKLMGLAPYGKPIYRDRILEKLVDVRSDGSFRLNMEYFAYPAGLTMTNERFAELFGGPPRRPESPVTQREMDIARSIQDVTEEIVLKIAAHVYRETGEENLCLAGGVALNCVANGRLLREGPFKRVWIQPAAGDAGGALGAALFAWYQYVGNARHTDGIHDAMHGSYLGPQFSSREIEDFLRKRSISYETLPDEHVAERIADLIAEENVVGYFRGRMEFGPRALGARSIIGDARSPKMQSTMNLKIKFRESFRPFAPSVLMERVADYFELDRESPYMLFVAKVRDKHMRKMTEAEEGLEGIAKLHVPRSDIPAVTHVDYSARIQTVHRETNPQYYELLKTFDKKYNCPMVVNTSFNVRGEPIVCTPEDAYRCFMRTEMDYLLIENYLLKKEAQPMFADIRDWKSEFALD